MSAEGRAYLLATRRPSFAAFRIVRALHRHSPKLGTIVDVGANRGQFAQACRYFYPSADLVVIEPIPELAGRLRAKLGQCPNVSVIEAAVGKETGEAKLGISSYDHLSSLRPPTPNRLRESPEARTVRTALVNVTTLDDQFRQHAVRGPVLLKLDVQGAEADVLAGGNDFLQRVDYIVYESSFTEMYQGEMVFTEMFDLVRSLGFELVAPLDFWRGPSHLICEVDLLFRRKGGQR